MAEHTFSDQNFATEVEGSDDIVMVDFWAEWCGPCKILGPTVTEIAGEMEGKIKIGKLNVDENQDTALKYQILSIPTIKFFKGGEVIDEIIGVQSKDQLMTKINGLLEWSMT